MDLLRTIAGAARATRRHARRRIRPGCLALLALVCWTSAPRARADPAPSAEYQLKAVFLFNFLHFVQWPDSAYSSPTAPVRIGVLGNDPFGSALEETVRDEKIGDRRILILRSGETDDLTDCQVVFVAGSETRRPDSVLARLHRQPILTLGDSPGFASRHGGGIGFYTEGKKIRFEINVATLRRLGLKPSSELLGLGRIVGASPAEDAPPTVAGAGGGGADLDLGGREKGDR